MADEPTDILGTPSAEVEALFEDEPTPAEQPAETPEQVAPEAPAPEEPEQPQAEAETPAEEPSAEQQEVDDPFASYRDDQGLILGKYKTGEDWANAHRHQDQYATRIAQERSQAEKHAQEVQRHYDELRQKLQQAAPLIQRAAEQMQQQRQEIPEIDFSDPELMQAYINQEVNRRIEATLTPMQQQQQQAIEQARYEAEIGQKRNEFMSWVQENPDVVPPPAPNVPGNEVYNALSNVVYTLQFDPEKQQAVEENFPLNRQNLSLAKTLATEPQTFDMARRLDFVPSDEQDIQLLRDAASNPALADHLEANPAYLETVKGHTIARQLAGMPQAVTQAQANGEQAMQQNQEAQRKAAYVESDTSGTPATAAPGKRSEAWEELGGDLWEQERSIFNS